MVTHTSVLAWKIPWTEEPGGPQSMGSQRVRMINEIQNLFMSLLTICMSSQGKCLIKLPAFWGD